MATIINTPPERVIEVDRGGAISGWAVAVIILIAVVAGLVWWMRYHNATAAEQGATNINVTLPTGPGSDTSNPGY